MWQGEWQGRETPLIMGVVNVTPDSFSDGGQFSDTQDALTHALRLREEGADILDIGGESTRPHAKPVSLQEELDRVCPVIETLSKQTDALICVDTRHTKVMQECVKYGANMINDVNALQEEGALSFVAESKIPVCLMHMQKTPQTMQDNPLYEHVVEDVFSFLKERIHMCLKAGISRDSLCIDVGIGFGKTLEHNLALLKNIKHFHALDVPLLLGASRKSFIGEISGESDPEKRLGGSLASVLYGVSQNVHIFRVHDVKETSEALRVYRSIHA